MFNLIVKGKCKFTVYCILFFSQPAIAGVSKKAYEGNETASECENKVHPLSASSRFSLTQARFFARPFDLSVWKRKGKGKETAATQTMFFYHPHDARQHLISTVGVQVQV